MRHLVIHSADVAASTPAAFAGHSQGFTRQDLLDHNTASIHHGHNIGHLAPGGSIQTHVRSVEFGFYLLEGEVVLSRGGVSYHHVPGDYGLIPPGVAQSWWNPGSTPARWMEMISPQPRPLDSGKVADLFFLPQEQQPVSPAKPHFGDPRTRLIGHFDISQMPPHSALQMPGFRTPNINGVAIRMLIDRVFGASQFTLFMVEFMAGGHAGEHDHPFEESYLFLEGEARGILDGQEYHIKVGDLVWTGVGSTHGFTNIGSGPMRWIETQAPQPPTEWGFRFESDWKPLAG